MMDAFTPPMEVISGLANSFEAHYEARQAL